jgi:hypothetical protein
LGARLWRVGAEVGADGRGVEGRVRVLWVVLVVSFVAEGLAAAVAFGSDRVYWANDFGDKISFAKLDGTGGGDLSTGSATVSNPNFPVLLEAPQGRRRHQW